ncbi:hypothetical protein ACIQVK_03740 [Streptomyces sp. NPDC090493]|uniref:hypothetical protein n=1 Tax=Streptomyces sp. NPDC090493 TaxID=3365964 RepID=UPI00381377A2
MSRFEMNDLDRRTVERARAAVAGRTDVGYMSDVEMARRIGRLEAIVEGLIEMVDQAVTE